MGKMIMLNMLMDIVYVMKDREEFARFSLNSCIFYFAVVIILYILIVKYLIGKDKNKKK